MKKPVPHLSSALLQAQAFPFGQGGHILPENSKAKPEPSGKLPGSGFVSLGFFPSQLVVHMGQHQPVRVHLSHQPVGQSSGIRPAGEPHHHQSLLG